MYEVTQACRKAMAQACREPVSARMEIYNIDMGMQTAFARAASDGGACGNAYGVLSMRQGGQFDRATLEKNFMKADGQARFDVPGYYASYDLSAETADADGLYPLEGSLLRLTADGASWTVGRRNLTVVTDEATAEVYLRVTTESGTTVKQYAVNGNDPVIDDLPDTAISAIEISVTRLRAPLRRARIYRVYFGDVERYGGSDILSLSYSDKCDAMALELPEKVLTVETSNRYGLTAETEAGRPRYARIHTQARAELGIGVQGGTEWIPMGRWFMDTCALTASGTVSFSWVSAIAVLNESTHHYSGDGQRYVDDGILAVVKRPQAEPTLPDWEPPDVAATRYDIQVATPYYYYPDGETTYTVTNPCPTVSDAGALQLYANISRRALKVDRTAQAVGNLWNGADIVVDRVSLEPPSPHRYDLLESEIYKVSTPVEAQIREVTVGTTRATGETESKTLAVGLAVSAQPQLVKSDGWLSNVSTTPAGSSRRYGYAALVWGNGGRTATVTGTIRKTVQQDETYPTEAKEGTTLTLDNPLLDGDEVPVDLYKKWMLELKKHRVVYTLNHRGYPQFDATDCIHFSYKGEEIPLLIEENTITLSSGVMRGTTKGRRLN